METVSSDLRLSFILHLSHLDERNRKVSYVFKSRVNLQGKLARSQNLEARIQGYSQRKNTDKDRLAFTACNLGQNKWKT